jgi:hypothetical protein
LGPALNFKRIQLNLDHTPEKKKNIPQVFNHKMLEDAFKEVFKEYNNNFEKYKSVAKDYNIDLFICDVLMNNACLDIAHTLKKPIVAFSSFFQCN